MNEEERKEMIENVAEKILEIDPQCDFKMIIKMNNDYYDDNPDEERKIYFNNYEDINYIFSNASEFMKAMTEGDYNIDDDFFIMEGQSIYSFELADLKDNIDENILAEWIVDNNLLSEYYITLY